MSSYLRFLLLYTTHRNSNLTPVSRSSITSSLPSVATHGRPILVREPFYDYSPGSLWNEAGGTGMRKVHHLSDPITSLTP